MELKRELNLWEVVFTGVGIIFGAGIYTLVGVMTGLAGNGIWLSVLIGGSISLFTGLSYAFLSSRFQSNSSEYIYILKTFNKETIAMLAAYLMIISGIISASLVAIGFSMYFSALFPFQIPLIIPSIGLIILFTIILLLGIKESSYAIIIGTLIEAGGLVLIIIFGMPYVRNMDYFEFKSVEGIFSASIIAIFAFLGFEYITRLSEETKNPEKNIPKAIVLSIIIALIVYAFVAISSVAILGVENLAKSNAPLADVANKILGKNGFFILSVIGLFATANTVLGILLVTSRQIHGMCEMNAFVYSKFFCRIYNAVPINAIILSSCLAIIFLFISDLRILADLSVLPVLFVFIFVNIAAIILNFKEKKGKPKEGEGINKVYFFSSSLGVLCCIILILNEIILVLKM